MTRSDCKIAAANVESLARVHVKFFVTCDSSRCGVESLPKFGVGCPQPIIGALALSKLARFVVSVPT